MVVSHISLLGIFSCPPVFFFFFLFLPGVFGRRVALGEILGLDGGILGLDAAHPAGCVWLVT